MPNANARSAKPTQTTKEELDAALAQAKDRLAVAAAEAFSDNGLNGITYSSITVFRSMILSHISAISRALPGPLIARSITAEFDALISKELTHLISLIKASQSLRATLGATTATDESVKSYLEHGFRDFDQLCCRRLSHIPPELVKTALADDDDYIIQGLYENPAWSQTDQLSLAARLVNRLAPASTSRRRLDVRHCEALFLSNLAKKNLLTQPIKNVLWAATSVGALDRIGTNQREVSALLLALCPDSDLVAIFENIRDDALIVQQLLSLCRDKQTTVPPKIVTGVFGDLTDLPLDKTTTRHAYVLQDIAEDVRLTLGVEHLYALTNPILASGVLKQYLNSLLPKKHRILISIVPKPVALAIWAKLLPVSLAPVEGQDFWLDSWPFLNRRKHAAFDLALRQAFSLVLAAMPPLDQATCLSTAPNDAPNNWRNFLYSCLTPSKILPHQPARR